MAIIERLVIFQWRRESNQRIYPTPDRIKGREEKIERESENIMPELKERTNTERVNHRRTGAVWGEQKNVLPILPLVTAGIYNNRGGTPRRRRRVACGCG